jgi:hypothetical protein
VNLDHRGRFRARARTRTVTCTGIALADLAELVADFELHAWESGAADRHGPGAVRVVPLVVEVDPIRQRCRVPFPEPFTADWHDAHAMLKRIRFPGVDAVGAQETEAS